VALYGEQDGLPEKVPPAQRTTSVIWIPVLLVGLAVALCGQFYALRRARSLSRELDAYRRETAALREWQGEQIRRAYEREESHAQALSELKEEVDAASKRAESTRAELRRERETALRIEAQQHQTEALRSEIATKADRQAVDELAQTLSVAKNDLETTKLELEAKSQDFGAAGAELAASVKMQQEQIETLRKTLPGKIGPIYNAIFDPTVPPTRTHLYDGRKTSIRFFLGPPDAKNAIPAPKSLINEKILKKRGLVPLGVTMTCRACADESLQKRAIVYRSDEGISSEALFTITPLRARSRREDGFSQIIFDVSSQGVEYDHVAVDVFVDPPEGTKDTALGRAPSFPPPGEGYKPDVVFTFDWQSDGQLKVQVEPVDATIIKLCKAGCRDAGGDYRWLDAGSASREEIRELALRTYSTLKALVEQDPQLLREISPGADTKLSPNASNLPNSQDLNKILTTFFHLGAQFYRRVFLDDADPELRAFMKAFAKLSFSDRPIRVKIVARDIYLPWQFLHAPSQMSQDRFWGFRYELAVVNDSNNGRDGRLPDAINYAGSDPAVFALYRGEPREDTTVSEYGRREYAFFGQKFGNTGLISADSRGMFLDTLEHKGQALKLLLAYTHATSGVIEARASPDGPTVYLREVAGQRILFAKNDFVSVEDLNELRDNLDEDQDRFFLAQPLALLNACETGAPVQPIPDGKGRSQETLPNLPATMLRLGARGVIVTESPVWPGFAYHFEEDLIEELAHGVEVPRALYDVRRKYLGYNNPLGLLYSYYGTPGAKIVGSNLAK
jgi:hypothetical protein